MAVPPSIKVIPFEETWPIRHRVMWPSRDMDYVKIPDDPAGLHYGLFLEDKPISVISLFVREREMQFRKFATEQVHQGKGYGSQLLRYAFEEAQKLGIRRIWCNARLEKSAFYERFGMSKTPHNFEKGGILYVIMERIMVPL